MVSLQKTEWPFGRHRQKMVIAELDTHEDLLFTYRGVPLKRVEQFKYLWLIFMGFRGMATMVDARIVKAK